MVDPLEWELVSRRKVAEASHNIQSSPLVQN